LLLAAGVAALAGTGIAVFHVGVEQHWWQGTAECGSTLGAASSIEDMRRMLLAQPVVRCDEVAWSLFGISMAGYNALISLGLAAFALAALRQGLRIPKAIRA
jgi:disulfide bond formation protein DsbB